MAYINTNNPYVPSVTTPYYGNYYNYPQQPGYLPTPPYNYNQYIQQPQQTVPQGANNVQTPITHQAAPQQTPQSDMVVWVQGEAGARAYPVAPNSRMILMDSDDPVVYMKSADENGKPLPLRVFDLVERTESDSEKTAAATVDMSNYVTKDVLQEMFSSFEQKIGAMVAPPKSTSTLKKVSK